MLCEGLTDPGAKEQAEGLFQCLSFLTEDLLKLKKASFLFGLAFTHLAFLESLARTSLKRDLAVICVNCAHLST